MQINRFDSIAAELERLAAEITAINRQSFDPRIDLQTARQPGEIGEIASPSPIRDWRLSR